MVTKCVCACVCYLDIQTGHYYISGRRDDWQVLTANPLFHTDHLTYTQHNRQNSCLNFLFGVCVWAGFCPLVTEATNDTGPKITQLRVWE